MRQDTIHLPGAPAPPDAPAGAPPRRGDLTPELIATDRWTDGHLAAAGIPVVDVPFVSVGGGIGSFVTVDYLRICGVPTSAIRVLTQLNTPWESYEYLTRVSQIPRGERLRSDSASCPDNIWGFPGYAVREALAARSLREFVEPLFRIAVEPVFADYYTPKAGQAFASTLLAGGLWTLLITPLLPLPAPLTSAYATAFALLLALTVLGVGWEPVYHLLQQFRWEKDWPTLFGLLTAVNEGLVLWLLLEHGAVPGVGGPVSGAAFLIQFVTTWLVVWLSVHAMRVPFVHWRFRGGRLL